MISLVIPSMNKLYYTRRCLDSLLFTTGVDFEFVIVDNGSNDGTAEYLLEFRRRAAEQGVQRHACCCNDRNVGACTARNQAIRLCHGSEIAFLDNDIVLRDRRWLAVLRETLYQDERTALVTPKLLFPFPPFAIEHAGIAISPNGAIGYVGRGAERDDPRFNAPCVLQGAASACVLVRQDVLEEVGGFDEIFNPVQFEDLDLFYRMKSHGYHLLLSAGGGDVPFREYHHRQFPADQLQIPDHQKRHGIQTPLAPPVQHGKRPCRGDAALAGIAAPPHRRNRGAGSARVNDF